MRLDEARVALEDPSPLAECGLSVLRAIACASSSPELASTARELVILALDRENEFHENIEILRSLTCAVGLHPYIEHPAALGLSELLEYEFSRPFDFESDVVFHRAQAEVYRTLLEGNNVILSAPTSFGKSLVVDALIASGRYENVVVVVPTLALVDETRSRLSQRFARRFRILTHLTQEPGARNVYVSTQERLAGRENDIRADLLVIDEFYKLSPDRMDPRCALLNQVLYHFVRRGVQFYLLGPDIEHVVAGISSEPVRYTFIRSDFKTVVTRVQRVDPTPTAEDALAQLCATLDEPTVIYCKSPASAEAVGRLLARRQESPANSPEVTSAADWVATHYHPDWIVVGALRAGVGVHHGGIPRALGQAFVRLFNDGLLHFIVCTSTLIEGVNTAAKNVVVFDNQIGRHSLDFFTFSNIRGRSGRMFRHFTGRVYTFFDPPEPKLPLVDVPGLSQSEQAPTELLLQIDEGDLTDRSRERIDWIIEQNILPIDILRAIPGQQPEGLVSLAVRVENLSRADRKLLAWSRYPSYDQLKFAFRLTWEELKVNRGHGVLSAKQLAFLINRLRRAGSEPSFVRMQISGAAADDVDDLIAKSLSFCRNWAGFQAPQMLRALDIIQQHVLTRLGEPTGSYAWYAGMLESRFMPETLVALDEYGLPVQLAEKLVGEGLVDPAGTLDDALVALRTRDAGRILRKLGLFEREVLVRLLSSIGAGAP